MQPRSLELTLTHTQIFQQYFDQHDQGCHFKIITER